MGGTYSYTMPLIFTSINFIGELHYIYIVIVRNKKARREQIALLLSSDQLWGFCCFIAMYMETQCCHLPWHQVWT